MRYSFTIFFFLVAGINFLFSQNIPHNKELIQLRITDKELYNSINQSIDYLSQCVDYRDSLSFMISLEKSTGCIYIDITYTRNDENIFSLNKEPLGYLEIRGHHFFVFSSETFGLFEKTNQKGCFVLRQKSNYYFFEDSPEWLYCLKSGKIKLVKMINGCLDKDHKKIKFRFKKTD
ncbi:MAG: hypothetical protein Q8862_02430 [Bacteroidota bacterium]|nr:hypothetical protein [Bacteroidota bacterium]